RIPECRCRGFLPPACASYLSPDSLANAIQTHAIDDSLTVQTMEIYTRKQQGRARMSTALQGLLRGLRLWATSSPTRARSSEMIVCSGPASKFPSLAPAVQREFHVC